MSLLQEALKRKEQDQDNSETEAAPSAPANASAEDKNPRPAPPETEQSVPQDSPPESMPVLNRIQTEKSQGFRRKKSVLWVIVAAIAIFVSVAITAGFAYFFYRLLPLAKTKAVRVIPAVPPIVPPVFSPQNSTNEISTHPALKQTPAAVSVTGSTTGQPAAIAGHGPVSIKPSSTETKKTMASPAAKWPLLKLSGILHGLGSNENTALINGKLINTGQAIENVTLSEIQSEGVILEYGGEKRFLRVGAIAY